MGTVLIRRTSKEELLWARSLPSRRRFNSSNDYIYHVAMLELLPSTYYGVQASLSTNAPTAMRNQFTASSISLANGLYDHEDIIQAGWMVSTPLFGNLVPRVFIHWMVDGGRTGCYNFQCSGFVQISRSIAPGSHTQPVCIYGGDQFDLLFQIHKDVNNTGWWLTIEDQVIGYWPLALFKTLNEAASSAQWGGEIFSPRTAPGPQMGSGQFPEEGYQRAAFQRLTCVVDESKAWAAPNIYNVMDSSDKNDCYRVVEGPWGDDNPWLNSFYFGGPGGCEI
ncbi:hypothetical protein QJS04_geneDACA002026 [Acorus gramineus]|uniref:Neprosin PEP catalytic domain-containing protein n=1 Tax=Acorus gramineus TaxID=55184 RepID=A0AAV9A9M6_ACOGR|nr:hypothetical protein QJS04_geneDACA002026 [Acorus gramineus]